MSDDEIKTFITTFKSFMQHADVEEMNFLRRESTRKYKQLYYQSQAKKHNVSLDYYISEFTQDLLCHASTELNNIFQQDGML